MEAGEFVSRLAEVAPEKSKLLLSGRSEEGANAVVRRFACPLRHVPLDMETHEDQVLELIKGWDVSAVQIGMLCFLSEPVSSDEHMEIGAVEAEKLVFRFQTRDYVLLEHEVPGRVFSRVSCDGGSLLDALICIAAYYAKTGVDEIDIDDESIGLEVKAECLRHLGSDEFGGFCTTLLGH